MISHHFPIAWLYVSMLSWYCVTFSEKQEEIISFWLNAQTQKKWFPTPRNWYSSSPRLGIGIVVSHASELIKRFPTCQVSELILWFPTRENWWCVWQCLGIVDPKESHIMVYKMFSEMRAPWLVKTSSSYFHKARALRHTSSVLRYNARKPTSPVQARAIHGTLYERNRNSCSSSIVEFYKHLGIFRLVLLRTSLVFF